MAAATPAAAQVPGQAGQNLDQRRKQTQQSTLAKLVMSKATASSSSSSPKAQGEKPPLPVHYGPDSLLPPPTHATLAHMLKSLDYSRYLDNGSSDSASLANGTIGPFSIRPSIPHYESPYARSNASTAPGSPRIPPLRQNSGSHTPRIRPHATTLNIPGMTRSKVSPDGHIPDRDVAAKLVIIMVGLPARGKSYITKKLQRYLSWQQHNTRIFNVGNRRRIAAGMAPSAHPILSGHSLDQPQTESQPDSHTNRPVQQAASILLNGVPPPQIDEPTDFDLNDGTSEPDQSEGTAAKTELTEEALAIFENSIVLSEDDRTVKAPKSNYSDESPKIEQVDDTSSKVEHRKSAPAALADKASMMDLLSGKFTKATVKPAAENSEQVNGTDDTTACLTSDVAADLTNGTTAELTAGTAEVTVETEEDQEAMDQSAKFFDPKNESAAKLREQVALETLDELMDYLLHQNGAVGILDATNSTLQRRQLLVRHIKAREPKLGILFIESVCNDQNLLEANMRLKLSGPDYKDKDPVKSLSDFRARVKAYESAYEPLGEYEEKNDLQYIQMIDVGRKIVHHRLKGFLSANIASYLTTFNLSPRQIWITRHGQSVDNVSGKIGGDSELTERGHYYGLALYNFITAKRKEWVREQESMIARASFPPRPGDRTPPYPELNQDLEEKNFCVWTSMLNRTVETAEYFEADDDYDVKAWEMLNELNAGNFEGLRYTDIAVKFPEEHAKRQADKLHYIYPGVGGEGYLQIINRLRDMVRETERVTDHALIISHRSVCRVLMAYFMDLTREDIADLDVPLGMLFAIHPKPYGMEFHAYKYNEPLGWFDEVPNYKPQKTKDRYN